jgi:hypothetical protein
MKKSQNIASFGFAKWFWPSIFTQDAEALRGKKKEKKGTLKCT